MVTVRVMTGTRPHSEIRSFVRRNASAKRLNPHLATRLSLEFRSVSKRLEAALSRERRQSRLLVSDGDGSEPLRTFGALRMVFDDLGVEQQRAF